MAFAVADFQDLLRLLDEHPAWQGELRRRLLTDELLELPALVRALTETQARTDLHIEALTLRFDQLAERMDQFTVRVGQLAEAQSRTEEHLAALDAHLVAIDARLDSLTAQVESLTISVQALTRQLDRYGQRVDRAMGDFLEWRYERHAAAYFSPLARRIHVLDSSRLATRLDDAADQGVISEAERADVIRADVVFSGRRRDDSVDALFVVEVSVGIGANDVRRAADRAAMLAKLGSPTVAVAAGRRIDPEPAQLAEALGVRVVLTREDQE